MPRADSYPASVVEPVSMLMFRGSVARSPSAVDATPRRERGFPVDPLKPECATVVRYGSNSVSISYPASKGLWRVIILHIEAVGTISCSVERKCSRIEGGALLYIESRAIAGVLRVSKCKLARLSIDLSGFRYELSPAHASNLRFVYFHFATRYSAATVNSWEIRSLLGSPKQRHGDYIRSYGHGEHLGLTRSYRGLRRPCLSFATSARVGCYDCELCEFTSCSGLFWIFKVIL